MRATIVIDRQGRLVIPAEFRADLGIEPGDTFHLTSRDGALVLYRSRDAIRQLQRLAAHVPTGRSLVDELIDQRRAETSSQR